MCLWIGERSNLLGEHAAPKSCPAISGSDSRIDKAWLPPEWRSDLLPPLPPSLPRSSPQSYRDAYPDPHPDPT